MFYEWLVQNTEAVSALNIFRYITFRSFLSFFTSFAVCIWLGPKFIRHMVKKQIGQTIRDDGPQSHLSKKGTPTMGGGLILISVMVPCLLWVNLINPFVAGALAVTILFGAVGYVDDWLKVSKKNTKGLPGRLRLFVEFLVVIIVIAILQNNFDFAPELHFPFLKGWFIDVGVLFPLVAAFVVVGCANAVNLTDGLDGLAIMPVVISALTLGIFAYVSGHREIAGYLSIPHVAGSGELAPLCAAVIAAGLGFLWFNAYPAQVFMGDVGSLSLGGFLGILAVLTRNEVLLVLLGGVFVVEALSVITQVISFKLTGKRVFKMAPIHHHFEIKGLSENKIIVRFWIVSILLAILSLATLKLR